MIDKIEADILKMVVYEIDSEINYTKYIIVCDEAVVTSMRGTSVILASTKLYNITILRIPIDDIT